MHCRRALLPIVAALCAGLAGCRDTRLQDLPLPDTGPMEPEVQRQIAERYAVLEALAAAGASGEELAEGIGDMGRLLHAYDLTAAASAYYERAAGLAPAEFRWHYLLGFARQTRGELAAAAESLEAALELRPDDVPALARLGALRIRQGRAREARRLLERALDLDPGCAFALRGLGEMDLEEGDAVSALGRFRRALELQPGASSLHFLMATALRETGDLEAAAAHLERYADVPVELADPLAEAMVAEASGASAWLLRGHTSLKEGHLEEAVRSYRKALELDPGNVPGRESLAYALADLGDVNGSLIELRSLLAEGRGSARVHFLLGRLLVASGDDRAALGHYQRAVELNPDDETALFNKASAHARLGQFAAAAEGYGRVVEMDPRDVLARYRLAMVLEALGREPEALAELERAATDDPENEEIRVRLSALRERLTVAE